jgi:hypothetical protein
MVQREFNASLYVSEIFDAIQGYVADSERDFINIVITGPAKHSTGLITDELIGTGASGLSTLPINVILKNTPVVPAEFSISVSGTEVGYDDGNGQVIAATGTYYTAEGLIDYTSGTINVLVTPAPAIGVQVFATYYKSKIDSRGNYICPLGHVLQYGNVIVRPLSRS